MKVSKVILIVVALHVLVIGGIFVFEGCSRTKVQAPELADNETLPGQAMSDLANTPATTPAESLALPTGPSPALPEVPVAAAPVAKTYTVQKGDSLWKIAKTENVTIAELSAANNLTKTSTLKLGQKLTIPSKAPATVAAAPLAPAGIAATAATTPGVTPVVADAGTAYTVASGDSLWKIANKNGTTVSALKKANNLNSEVLKVGQKLTIPAKVQTASAPVPAVSAGVAIASYDVREPGTYQENGQTVHIVENGESPAIIAKKYGVKTEDLLRVNNIKPGMQIHYGQPLVIPSAAPSAALRPVSNVTSSPDASLAAPIVSAPMATLN